MINLIGRWQVGLGVFKGNGKNTCSFFVCHVDWIK